MTINSWALARCAHFVAQLTARPGPNEVIGSANPDLLDDQRARADADLEAGPRDCSELASTIAGTSSFSLSVFGVTPTLIAAFLAALAVKQTEQIVALGRDEVRLELNDEPDAATSHGFVNASYSSSGA